MSITLTLNNFKRYDTKTSFTLPQSGLVLIQGSSGIGKTSILDSIYFLLYGIGSKIVNFSANTCSVSMEDESITITRTKKPNRLTLKENGITYEDQVAQEIINSKYGTNFEITSYIKYKASTSFFSLGPSARMEFLQRIAIKGTNVQMLKNRTKEAIKIRKENLLKISSELKVVETEFNSLESPLRVLFPFGKFHENKIKNHKTRSKNNKIKLSNGEKLLKSALKSYRESELQKQTNVFIQTKIDEYSNTLEIIKKQISEYTLPDILNISGMLITLQTNKQYTETKYKIEEMEVKLEEYKSSEDQKRSEELQKLKSIPLIEDKTQEYSRLSEVNKKIIQCKTSLEKNKISVKDYLDCTDEVLQSLNKKLENCTGKKFICPGCSCSLLFKDETLHVSNESLVEGEGESLLIKSEIKSLKEKLKQRSVLEANISIDEKFLISHRDFDMSIDYSKLYKENLQNVKIQDSNKIEIKKLENITYSTYIKKWENDIEKLKKDLLKMEYITVNTEYTIEDLKIILNKQSEKTNLQKEIDKITEGIEENSKKIKILKEENYPQKINSLEEEIKNIKCEIAENEGDEIRLNEYIKYTEKKENYDKWLTKLENLQINEKNGIKSLEVSEKFLTIVNETESKAVSNIINSLNIQLKYYSEQFFTEPIGIQIQPFKESQSGNIKPSVNIKVSYKGMDYDVDCLSGGETSRVELAVCLAINSVINGKILLLDEVLGTLNSGYIDTITSVLREEALKENKLILTVLHGATEGNFDNVITID